MNITVADLEISDDEAEKMPLLFQKLREEYLRWKKDAILPSGERWLPQRTSKLSEVSE